MKTKFEFKPFDKVLVRDDDEEEWRCGIYSHDNNCINGYWGQIIPFEGNEHLLGTDDPYVEAYEPKDGDFVYIICRYDDNSACPFVYIQKGNEGSYKDYYLFSCPSTKTLEREGERKFHYDCIIEEIRPATDEEKNQLLSKLHKIGKDWNAEKKEIVDWKWQPNEKEKFYAPGFDTEENRFYVEAFKWFNDDPFCKTLLERGWCFHTELECAVLRDKLNAAIKNVE